MIRKLTTAALFLCALGGTLRAADVDVMQFGAVSDGKRVNTDALQKAIDTCSKQGGGMVNVPAGNFVTGTIVIKNGVTLHLAKDAIIHGSEDIKDYKVIDTFTEGTGKKSGLFLIGTVDAKNVGISGEGTIDGHGKALQNGQIDGTRMRPFLVRWVRSENVNISGVKLTNAGMWCMHISASKNVKVDGVTIVNKENGNNDGIDIDSSDTVKVTGCDIDSRDDAMCLKATGTEACRNVEISDCKLKSNCAAVKFGTESVGDFENVKITHCQIRDTGLGGIKILSVDGSHIKNIELSGLTMDGVNVPIFLRLGSRLKTYHPGDKARETGSIESVTIRDIKVKNGKQAGIMISGVPGHEVGPNVSIENVEMELAGGGKWHQSDAAIVENEKAYPEIRMFGNSIPGSAIWARHAKGLSISNLKVTTRTADDKPAVVLDDVADVKIAHSDLLSGSESESMFFLSEARNVSVEGIKGRSKSGSFMTVFGNKTENIRLKNNDEKEVTLSANVVPGKVKKE